MPLEVARVTVEVARPYKMPVAAHAIDHANILVVAGDPLQEIEALGEPLLVLRPGRIIRDGRE